MIANQAGFQKQKYFTLDLATQRELPAVDFSARRKTDAPNAGSSENQKAD